MDLIVTNWIGMEVTALLAREREQELKARFPVSLIETAKSFGGYESAKAEEEIASWGSKYYSCQMKGTGILQSLWHIAEEAGMGMEVDMRKIPIRQETVEICEYFDINPYNARSGGAMLVALNESEAFIAGMVQRKIPAVKIGRLHKGNDRVLWNDGNKRYLDRPQIEELVKFQER